MARARSRAGGAGGGDRGARWGPRSRPRLVVQSRGRCGCGCGGRRRVRAGLLFERTLAVAAGLGAPLLRPFSLHPERVLVPPGARGGLAARGYFGSRSGPSTIPPPCAPGGTCGVDAVITNDPARTRRACRAGRPDDRVAVAGRAAPRRRSARPRRWPPPRPPPAACPACAPLRAQVSVPARTGSESGRSPAPRR